MIEPQNTMMPLPAESAQVDMPQGEAGFGEMLAQTLGMVIPQVDPNAIKGVGQQNEQPADEGDVLGSSQQGGAEKEQVAAPMRFVTLPLDGNVKVSAPITIPTRTAWSTISTRRPSRAT